MSVIGSFTTFDLVWVMTRGGPYGSSETLAVTMFNESFNLFHVGTGAAIAIVLSLCTLGFSILYLRTVFKRERGRERVRERKSETEVCMYIYICVCVRYII